jgi:hypothetical protein
MYSAHGSPSHDFPPPGLAALGAGEFRQVQATAFGPEECDRGEQGQARHSQDRFRAHHDLVVLD